MYGVKHCALPIFIFICFLISPCFAHGLLIIEPEDNLQPIIEAIQQAKSSIDLAMYGFTDQDLMQVFIRAKQEGKRVRILLQHFPYRSADENVLAIQRFSAEHVAYQFLLPSFYLLHQKTLIIDHRLAIVMTFNFTRSAFKNERNFGLIITDPALVQDIQRVFDADWQHKESYPNHSDLIWSPDNSRDKILAFIRSAKSEIQIYAQELSDYQVVGALAKAARQGVKVQMLTSSTLQESTKWNYLQKAGVECRRDDQKIIHAKVMIIDQNKAMLGSINFTKTSLDRNRELSVIINNSTVVEELVTIFRSDWSKGSSCLSKHSASSPQNVY